MSNINKLRVYELAKELGYSSKDFLDMLRAMGVDARSNFSVLEDPTVKRIRETIKPRGEGGPPPAEEKAPAHEEPAPETVAPPPAPVVRRAPTPSGAPGTMVTTIDPAAAAAVSMARSGTGPKPKPGGEVRRIIPAAKLEALRSQQPGAPPAQARPVGPGAPGAMPPRPADGAPSAGAPRPLGAPPPSGQLPPRPVTPGMAPPRPGVAPQAPAGAQAPPRPLAPGSPTAPPRPVAGAPGAPPARPAGTAPQSAVPGARPAPTPGPAAPAPPRPMTPGVSGAQGAPPARPAAPGAPVTNASMERPAAGSAPTAPRPQAPAGSPPMRPTAPAPSDAQRSAPPARTAPPPTPIPVTAENAPPTAMQSAPPRRPLSGPAVRPQISPQPSPPQQQGRPGGYGGPQRPGMYGRGPQQGRYGGGGGRHGDRGGPRGGGRKGYGAPPPVPQAPAIELKDIELPDHISVMELAGKLGIAPAEIIKTLMSQGLLVTINQTITFDKAQQIAVSHGYNAILTEEHEEVTQESEKEEDLVTRPPVVTVLGHVDHGKTSLLDAIRNTNVTAGEAGGITQSIGAYSVDHAGRAVTFIDTPGHEAFTAMRARGAKVTDVAVLVVAADDGIMPQTVEAINHAKAAKVPIVVAVNKIDKPNANVDRVKQQLTEYELVPEDWGGTTICAPISAKLKTGIDDLLEMILLVADMQELRANPNRKAQGIIIEAKLDKGMGPVATVLVQAGTLKVNDAVVVGQAWGKVRALINDQGKRIGKVTPGYSAEIIGLNTVPVSGDLLQAVDDAKMAQSIAEQREQRTREKGSSVTSRTSLDDLFNKMQAGEVKDLNLIVKADNQGSVEALKHSLLRLSSDEVKVNVVHGGVGTITESDILLATASSAIVIGFNVRPDPNVKKLADQEGVDIRNYRVIYHVIEDIQAAMKGMLAPEFQEVQLGRVEVRELFSFSKIGTIAGCYVLEGKVTRGADVRVLRDNIVVFEGKLDSLKRFKDDAREVQAGYECGLTIERFPGIQKGDILEVYKMEEKPRD